MIREANLGHQKMVEKWADVGREDTQFKKGWAGGPGAPRGPRWTTRFIKYIQKHGLKDDVDSAFVGLMLGDEKLLNGRKPSMAAFKEFLDRTDGKIPDIDPPKPDREKVIEELERLTNAGPEGGETTPPISQ